MVITLICEKTYGTILLLLFILLDASVFNPHLNMNMDIYIHDNPRTLQIYEKLEKY